MTTRPSWINMAVVAGLLAAVVVAEPGDSSDYVQQVGGALQDFDRAQQLLADQPDAARPLFRAAAQRMESVAAEVPNGRLEYNIGNAYLQAGDVGRAILHYRRAERLIPRDAMLADNLAEARLRKLVPVRPRARDRVVNALLFWHEQTSQRERATVAALSFIAVFVLLTIRLAYPRRGWTVGALLCGVVFVIAAGSVGIERWRERHTPPGVVLAMDVPAYKGPGASYQRQFEQPLQPGVEFTLRERRGNWWRIELADGKSGWIEAAQADLVVPDRAARSLG